MTPSERLTAFKQTLADAGERFGIRIAIVQQLGSVVLDEPALGYVLLDRGEESLKGTMDDLFVRETPVPLAQSDSPSLPAERGLGGEVEAAAFPQHDSCGG